MVPRRWFYVLSFELKSGTIEPLLRLRRPGVHRDSRRSPDIICGKSYQQRIALCGGAVNPAFPAKPIIHNHHETEGVGAGYTSAFLTNIAYKEATVAGSQSKCANFAAQPGRLLLRHCSELSLADLAEAGGRL